MHTTLSIIGTIITMTALCCGSSNSSSNGVLATTTPSDNLLHEALMADNATLAIVHIQAGADPNASYRGLTPLQRAQTLAKEEDLYHVAKQLVVAGASWEGAPPCHATDSRPGWEFFCTEYSFYTMHVDSAQFFQKDLVTMGDCKAMHREYMARKYDPSTITTATINHGATKKPHHAERE